MLKVTVAQDGSGDFASIAEAVLAVPYKEEALVQVGPGIYREKLVCEKRCITLRGAGADKTKLVWGDGGKLPHKDGVTGHKSDPSGSADVWPPPSAWRRAR